VGTDPEDSPNREKFRGGRNPQGGESTDGIHGRESRNPANRSIVEKLRRG
jgi:hypothetical protein